MTFRYLRFPTATAVLAASLLLAPYPRVTLAQTDESPLEANEPPSDQPGMPGSVSRTAPQYRIGVGDAIVIDVFDVPEMKRTVRVRDDGTVPLPLVGDLSVAGRTLREAEDLLEQRLSARQLVVEPQVTLSVAEYSSLAVTMLGAVGKPGTHQLSGGWSILEMLGRAGGVEADAGRRILIQRADENARRQTFLLDRERLLVSGDPALNVQLRPGDIVIVPRAEIYRVYVGGAVAKAGPLSFDRDQGLTLLQALVASAASPDRKEARRVTVLRSTPDGGREELTRDLELLWAGQTDDLELQPGDIVVVGQK